MILIDILSFMVNIFKWVCFCIVLLFIYSYVKKLIMKERLSFKQWMFCTFLVLYVIIFVFAPDVLSFLWIMVIFISNIFLDYEDKRTGKKWWNW